MSRVVYPARETVTEIRGEDAAEIINKMMEKEGMTQIQLAQKMGITRQRVSSLDNPHEILISHISGN